MKKFFNKIVLFLTSLFTDLDSWIHDHVQPSIEMVERIKAIVASPVGNLIAALIPGGLGVEAQQEIIALLTKALNTMHVTTDILHEELWENKVTKLVAYLKTLSKPMQDAIYLKLAAELAKASAGEAEYKGHSIDLLVQMQYSKLKEAVNADDLGNETIVNGEVVTPVEEPVIPPVTEPVIPPASPSGYQETTQQFKA